MDDIVVKPEVPQEDPSYVQQMIAKVDGEPPSNSTEGLLAGKYKNEEELTKGILEVLKKQHGIEDLEGLYKTLESAMNKPPKEEPKPTLEEEVKEPTEDSKGTLDFSIYAEEYFEKGELSETSYKALESYGVPREIADMFIEGQKALAYQAQQEFYRITGGQENYEAMTKWAQLNLSQAEIEAFNKALNTDMAVAKMATEALYGRYIASKGNAPKTLISGSANGPSIDGAVYESLEQLKADMGDPRYAKDPAFRKKVQDKLARSNIL